MMGLDVICTRKVSLELTPDSWDLYTQSFDCNHVAAMLNAAIEAAVNSGLDRAAVVARVMPTFNKYSKYGTMDSEPLYKLDQVLDKIFGREK